MTTEQIAQYIIHRVKEISETHSDKRTQHAYEQGLLVGMLASLAYRDSQNLDLIKNQFDKLTK